MKKVLLSIGLFLLTVSMAYGAGTLTQDYATHGAMKVATLTWTTSAGGVFTSTATSKSINGFVVSVETDPDGTAVPTAAYDITLLDSGSADIMGGALANRSATATEITMPLLNGNYTGIAVQGALTLTVSAAGNSKTGVVKIFYYAQ
jgi:hypothetical protein